MHITELPFEIRPGVKLVLDNTLTPILDADEPSQVRFILVSAIDITGQVQTSKVQEKSGQSKDGQS